uniref:Uncharacterized protein n=2 Tax=Physcomitrium patens TaxID=3218 RepID=A0A7I3Z9K9_PHYPA
FLAPLVVCQCHCESPSLQVPTTYCRVCLAQPQA